MHSIMSPVKPGWQILTVDSSL